jgi:hypothetical protein
MALLPTWPPVRLFVTRRSPRRPGSRAMCSVPWLAARVAIKLRKRVDSA